MGIMSFIILLLIGCVSALPSDQKTCPDYKSEINFNATAFGVGLWYDYARYPNEFQNEKKCYTFISKKIKGRNIKTKTYKIPQYSPEYFEYIPEQVLDGETIFAVSYGKPRTTIKIKVNSLFADYDKYCVFYGCQLDETRNIVLEYSWVVTRSKNLTPEDKTAIAEFIKSIKILNTSKFIWADYSNKTCKMIKETTP